MYSSHRLAGRMSHRWECFSPEKDVIHDYQLRSRLSTPLNCCNKRALSTIDSFSGEPSDLISRLDQGEPSHGFFFIFLHKKNRGWRETFVEEVMWLKMGFECCNLRGKKFKSFPKSTKIGKREIDWPRSDKVESRQIDNRCEWLAPCIGRVTHILSSRWLMASSTKSRQDLDINTCGLQPICISQCYYP